MATRFLTVILFVLAVVASSALTVIYLDKNNSSHAAGVDEDTIKKVVADFVEENPQAIVEALKKAQIKQAEVEAREAEKNVASVRGELESAEPISGDKNDPISMIVFHDYNCGYCRKVIPEVNTLIKENDDLKIILVDFPILGPTSEMKSRISLAVAEVAPEKHLEFYKELSNKNPKTKPQVLELAAGLGVDKGKIEALMESPKIDNAIAKNRSIAQRIGIRGTPAFVINGKLIKGAVGIDAFRDAIEEARG